MKKIALLCIVVAGLSASGIEFVSNSYQERVVKDESGKESIKLLSATKVLPGDTVIYVNSATNKTAKTIDHVLVTNPISEHMEYVAYSAQCSTECTILFSIDGGKSYAPAAELFVKQEDKMVLAKPSQYTTVRWNIDTVAPSSTTDVTFRAKLK